MRIPLSIAAFALLCAGGTHAQTQAGAPQRHRIQGVVIDSAGDVVAGAEVRLVGRMLLSVVRTGDDGRFALTGDIGGPSTLQVRRIGFYPKEVALAFPRDSSRSLEVVLMRSPAFLADVDVLGRPTEVDAALREFNERRRTNSFGRFFTRETFVNHRVRNASEILRTTPGVTLIGSRRGGFALRMRSCRVPPLVWVDGMRIPNSELDEVVNADDIAALEVYVSTAGVPAQYMDRSNSGCGTIVVWTRHQ